MKYVQKGIRVCTVMKEAGKSLNLRISFSRPGNWQSQ